MKAKREELEMSQMQVSLLTFGESYNENIPAGFPRASITALKKFQIAHPMLFKHGDTWSIAKHRKRLIDWLSSHREIS